MGNGSLRVKLADSEFEVQTLEFQWNRVHRVGHRRTSSNALRIDDGPIVDRSTRIQSARGFEEEHMNFINGDGPVLNTSRNNQELTFLKLDTTIAKLHAEAPLDH